MNIFFRNMRFMNMRLLFLLILTTLLSACTWVKATSEGESVKVLTAAQAQNQNCERLGQTNTQTMNRILFFERSIPKKTEELQKLAKNEAANMGGNAVVAEGEMQNGRQTFGIYKCQ